MPEPERPTKPHAEPAAAAALPETVVLTGAPAEILMTATPLVGDQPLAPLAPLAPPEPAPAGAPASAGTPGKSVTAPEP